MNDDFERHREQRRRRQQLRESAAEDDSLGGSSTVDVEEQQRQYTRQREEWDVEDQRRDKRASPGSASPPGSTPQRAETSSSAVRVKVPTPQQVAHESVDGNDAPVDSSIAAAYHTLHGASVSPSINACSTAASEKDLLSRSTLRNDPTAAYPSAHSSSKTSSFDDDLELKSAKELKAMLVQAQVDFSGCVEKAELVAKCRENSLFVIAAAARARSAGQPRASPPPSSNFATAAPPRDHDDGIRVAGKSETAGPAVAAAAALKETQQQRVQSLRQGEADKEDLAEKKQALVARLEKSLGSKVNTAQPSEYLEKLYSVAGNVEPRW